MVMGKDRFVVLFDLDGTLLYTLEDLKNSVNFVLQKYNYPLRSLDEIRNFVGNGVRILMEKAVPDGARNPQFEKLLELFKQHYAQNMYAKTKPFDGIDELLDNLKSRGCLIAVVSNKFDKAVKELCKHYFDGKIDIAIGEDEHVRKKPAPDSIFKAMKLLGCDKAVFVGDSEVDIQTAKNAGLKCISVTYGYKSKDFLLNNGAEFLADTPGEILKFVNL